MQNLPFHRWYKWLERKFLELRDAFQRQEKVDKVEYDFCNWNKEEKEELEQINKRRPDSTTKRAKRFFGKLKRAVKGKDKNKESSESHHKSNAGSTPKKLN